MSSILEALNKVEEDRNAQAASDDDADAPFAPEMAAETLIAQPKKRRSARQSPPINLKPILYAAGALVSLAVIAAFSATVAVLVSRAGHTAPTVALAAESAAGTPLQATGNETYTVPAPETKADPAPLEVKTVEPAGTPSEQPRETQAVPVEARPKPAPKAVVAAEPKPKPAPQAQIKAPRPEPAAPVAEQPGPFATELVAKAVPPPAEEPTTPLPTQEEIDRARTAPTEEEPQAAAPVRSSPVSLAPGRAAEKRAPFLEDINTLPRLGQTERERLGLGDLRLNVLREASPSQPEGLAIINLKKVFVGEMIPGTNARLIAVRTRAVAIEIEGTGERFKVTN